MSWAPVSAPFLSRRATFPVPASQRHPQRSQLILILRHRVRTVLQKRASDRRTSPPQRQMQRCCRPVILPSGRRVRAILEKDPDGAVLCADASAPGSRSICGLLLCGLRKDAGCSGVDLSSLWTFTLAPGSRFERHVGGFHASPSRRLM